MPPRDEGILMGNDRRTTLPATLRDALVLSGPLLLTIIAVVHPTGTDLVATAAHHPDLWLVVHVVQLPVFGLVGVSLFLLGTRGGGVVRAVNVIGVWLFLVFYTAMDTLAGIASGVLVTRAHHLPTDQEQVVLDQIQAFSADFSAPLSEAGWPAFTLTVLGGIGWMMATIGAAVALRRSGAPRLACLLIALGAVYLIHDMPSAPFAAASLLAGTIWVTVHSRRHRPPVTTPNPG